MGQFAPRLQSQTGLPKRTPLLLNGPGQGPRQTGGQLPKTPVHWGSGPDSFVTPGCAISGPPTPATYPGFDFFL